jgi:hypothetical protein
MVDRTDNQTRNQTLLEGNNRCQSMCGGTHWALSANQDGQKHESPDGQSGPANIWLWTLLASPYDIPA